MEGVPKQERFTGLEDDPALVAKWRENQAEAPARARELVANIEGLENMTTAEQRRVIKELLEELAKDNENRSLVEDVASQADSIIAANAYQRAADLIAPSPLGTHMLTEA